MNDIETRVARGAQLLDERMPGWENKIDVENLMLENECACVLGQLEGCFWKGAAIALSVNEASDNCSKWNLLDATAEYGFSFGFCGAADWNALTTAWRTLIEQRRSVVTVRPEAEQVATPSYSLAK